MSHRRCAAPAALSAASPPRGSLGVSHAPHTSALAPARADFWTRPLPRCDYEAQQSVLNGLEIDGAPCPLPLRARSVPSARAWTLKCPVHLQGPIPIAIAACSIRCPLTAMNARACCSQLRVSIVLAGHDATETGQQCVMHGRDRDRHVVKARRDAPPRAARARGGQQPPAARTPAARTPAARTLAARFSASALASRPHRAVPAARTLVFARFRPDTLVYS